MKLTAEIVNGKCPTCSEFTMLVGLSKEFYRCMNCGAVYDQMVWAGGLAPASGQQNGWWELQWTSKEASDAAF